VVGLRPYRLAIPRQRGPLLYVVAGANPENAMFTHNASGQALFGTATGPVTPKSPLKPFVDGQGGF